MQGTPDYTRSLKFILDLFSRENGRKADGIELGLGDDNPGGVKLTGTFAIGGAAWKSTK